MNRCDCVAWHYAHVPGLGCQWAMRQLIDNADRRDREPRPQRERSAA